MRPYRPSELDVIARRIGADAVEIHHVIDTVVFAVRVGGETASRAVSISDMYRSELPEPAFTAQTLMSLVIEIRDRESLYRIGKTIDDERYNGYIQYKQKALYEMFRMPDDAINPTLKDEDMRPKLAKQEDRKPIDRFAAVAMEMEDL